MFHMDSNKIITGPYVDVKSSQSRPYTVNVYVPGVGGERFRFQDSAEAVAFASAQRAEQEAS